MTEVVAALIWDGDRFMICQRPAHKARGLLWEFVGGKVEAGETKEEALIRECREELDITLRVGELFMEVTHEYPDLTVHLSLFHAFIAAGEPKLLEHRDLKWITPDEIPLYEFCPADEAILSRIREKALTEEVLLAWELPGRPIRMERLGEGHINDTFLVTLRDDQGSTCRCILQRLPCTVFPQPEALMENFALVTSHLREKIRREGGDPQRETLSLIPARDGLSFRRGRDGSLWRLMPFIENTFIAEQGTPALLEGAARAFGSFLRRLADCPPGTLSETLPHFHDTEERLERLEQAIKKDPLGRACAASEEIRFLKARRADASVIGDAQRRGFLPLRVTHGDARLSNVLFDRKTGEGICVIDLDTVMPGLSVFDFGDLVRSGMLQAAAPDEIRFDPLLFDAALRGFLKESARVLTRTEKEYLPWGARIITLELGIRYLTDYLEGDLYFRTANPGRNLDRCRAQIRLLRSMEAQFATMQRITARYLT